MITTTGAIEGTPIQPTAKPPAPTAQPIAQPPTKWPEVKTADERQIFHGASDETVPVEQSRSLVPALKAAGANVRYTEYPDTNHVGGAEKAYADPEVIKWLLAQRRGQRN